MPEAVARSPADGEAGPAGPAFLFAAGWQAGGLPWRFAARMGMGA